MLVLEGWPLRPPGRIQGPSGRLLGPPGRLLGPSGCLLAPPGHPGVPWVSWAHLEAWSLPGASWVPSQVFWGPLKPPGRLLGVSWGLIWVSLGDHHFDQHHEWYAMTSIYMCCQSVSLLNLRVVRVGVASTQARSREKRRATPYLTYYRRPTTYILQPTTFYYYL